LKIGRATLPPKLSLVRLDGFPPELLREAAAVLDEFGTRPGVANSPAALAGGALWLVVCRRHPDERPTGMSQAAIAKALDIAEPTLTKAFKLLQSSGVGTAMRPP
jgi:hypothetical protein